MDCTGSNFEPHFCPNNTSPQGQIFYAAITAGGITPPQNYAVYAVDQCDGPEGVADKTYTVVPGAGNQVGRTAIEQDMIAQCSTHH